MNSGTVDSKEFKTCPFCKEEIRATAIKCRFCGEWLEERPRSETVEEANLADSAPVPQPPPIPDCTQPTSSAPATAELNSGKTLPRLLSAKWLSALSVSLLFLAFGVMAFTLKDANFNGAGDEKLGEIIGRMLICAGISTWIAWGASGKRKDYAFLTFSIVCAGMAFVFAYYFQVGVKNAKQRSKESSRVLATNLMEMVQQATNGGVPSMKPTGDAEMDAAVRPLNTLMKDYNGLLQSMENELAVLNARDVYSTPVLSEKSAIDAEIRKRIESQTIIQKAKDEYPALVEAARKSLASLRLSKGATRGAALGIQDSLDAQTPKIEQMFLLRLRVESVELQFLQFMAAAFGDYQLSVESVVFKTASNSKKYNELVQQIQDTVKQAEAFQKQQLDAVEAGKQKFLKLNK